MTSTTHVPALGLCLASLLAFAGSTEDRTPTTRSASSEGTPFVTRQASADGATRSVWDGVYTAAQAGRGRKEYLATCAICHSNDLRGGDMAPGLIGNSLVEYWSEDAIGSVGNLFESIRETMPEDAPGDLSDRVYADILAFLFEANKFPAGDEELARDVEQLGLITIEPAPPE